MERKKFDDKWRNALRDAEVDPSDKVWTNIELDLEKAEMGSFRHRLVFYKMVAAASVIFALAAGAMGVYFFDQNRSNQKIVINLLREQNQLALNAQRSAVTDKVEEAQSDNNQDSSSDLISNRERKTRLKLKSGRYDHVAKTNSKGRSENNDNTISDYNNEVTKITIPVFDEKNNEIISEFPTDHASQLAYQPENAYQSEVKPLQEAEVDPVVSMMAKLEKREEELKKEESNKKNDAKSAASSEDLWTSVGFAAGSFNSYGAGVTPTAENTALFSNTATRNASKQEATASGMTYSVGLNVGKRLSKKWIIQSGLSYMNQSSNYTAQTAVSSKDYQTFTPESINAFDRLNSAQKSPYASTDAMSEQNTVINTAPYDVNNTVRYLSVPVQAGYMLIDSKVGLQLNAGVSTDLFLKNTKKAASENLQTIDDGIGENTPYRAMNISGLIGSELSYRVGSRYRISINPGLRYPFNSIYKSDLGIKSSPITMDLGLRFRYIFQ